MELAAGLFGEAFQHEENRVGDAVRVFVVIAGTVMLGLFLKVARAVRNTRQWGMYACVCFGISAIGNVLERFGETVTFRLPFDLAGVVFGLIFLYKNQHPVNHGRRATDTPNREGTSHDRRTH